MTDSRLPSFDQLIDPKDLDYWQVKKRNRIRRIMEILHERQEVDYDGFIGEVSTLCGIRDKTLEEYIRNLENFGVIRIEDDKIIWCRNIEDSE